MCNLACEVFFGSPGIRSKKATLLWGLLFSYLISQVVGLFS